MATKKSFAYVSMSRSELDTWKKYKQHKAVALVKRGYSVEWYPDANAWIKVYVPQRDDAGTPELCASVKCHMTPAVGGIRGGRITKLSIERSRSNLDHLVGDAPEDGTEVLFHYDRGPDVDRLRRDKVAQKLYKTVLEELN